MLNEHQGENSQSCLSPGENSRGSGEYLPGKSGRMKMRASEIKHTQQVHRVRENSVWSIEFG